MIGQIEFKPTFPLKFVVFYYNILTLRTYKYILKLHHVEIFFKSINHLFSPTSTSLDKLKSREKVQLLFLNLLECILDM